MPVSSLLKLARHSVSGIFLKGCAMASIVIDPRGYSEDELEEIVALFVGLAFELMEEGEDEGATLTGMGLALRLLMEEFGEAERLH